MILDRLLTFTGTSSGASAGITSGPQTDAPTTGTQAASNVIDIGLAGLPASASGGGARDLGIGDDPALKLLAVVTTAFTSGTSVQLQLQGAPDNGSGAAGSYTTMWTGPVITEANLTVGAQLANIDLPRPVPGQALPRFFQLNFISVGTHATSGVEATFVLDRFDQITSATGFASGYPAGINIAN
jgi:hypothetical protein